MNTCGEIMKLTRKKLRNMISRVIKEGYSFSSGYEGGISYDNSAGDSVDTDSASPYFHLTNEANVDLDEDNEEVTFTFFTSAGSKIYLEDLEWNEMPDTSNGDEYFFLIEKLLQMKVVLPHDAEQEVFVQHDYKYLQDAYEEYLFEKEEMENAY